MGSNPIAEHRAKLGLSRDELGARLGVSGRTISYWESWKKIPGPSRADALRRTLGLNEVELWQACHRKAETQIARVFPERKPIW